MTLTESKDEQIAPNALWEMAAFLCMKRRGVDDNKKNQKKAQNAVIGTIEGFQENNGIDILEFPVNAFALAYLAAHFGLEIEGVTESLFNKVMEAVVDDFAENRELWYPAKPLSL